MLRRFVPDSIDVAPVRHKRVSDSGHEDGLIRFMPFAFDCGT